MLVKQENKMKCDMKDYDHVTNFILCSANI